MMFLDVRITGTNVYSYKNGNGIKYTFTKVFITKKAESFSSRRFPITIRLEKGDLLG